MAKNKKSKIPSWSDFAYPRVHCKRSLCLHNSKTTKSPRHSEANKQPVCSRSVSFIIWLWRSTFIMTSFIQIYNETEREEPSKLAQTGALWQEVLAERSVQPRVCREQLRQPGVRGWHDQDAEEGDGLQTVEEVWMINIGRTNFCF